MGGSPVKYGIWQSCWVSSLYLNYIVLCDVILMKPLKYLWYVFPVLSGCLRAD